MRTVVEGQTKQDAIAGFALLKEPPWNHSFYLEPVVIGYISALDSGTDWVQLRADLDALLTEKWANSSPGKDPEKRAEREERERRRIEQAVAREWARRDLDAAIRWYVDELPPGDATVEQRTLRLLSAVRPGDRYQVCGVAGGQSGGWCSIRSARLALRE